MKLGEQEQVQKETHFLALALVYMLSAVPVGRDPEVGWLHVRLVGLVAPMKKRL